MSKPILHVTNHIGATAGPLIQRAVYDSIARDHRCRIGLPGGSTPSSTMQWLAKHLRPSVYANLWITWVDERHLPVREEEPGWLAWHQDSNYRLAQEHWLAGVPHLPEQVLPMSRGGSLDDALKAYSAAFSTSFDDGLDVAVLGVGPDGHIASLFPGASTLQAQVPVVAILDSPKPPAQRISLSLPVLCAAKTVVLLARGANKADVLSRALKGDTSLPLGRLVCAGDVHWVLDRAAASEFM